MMYIVLMRVAITVIEETKVSHSDIAVILVAVSFAVARPALIGHLTGHLVNGLAAAARTLTSPPLCPCFYANQCEGIQNEQSLENQLRDVDSSGRLHIRSHLMAKRKHNKSQAVRDLLTDNPKMTTKDIVAAMSTKGMKISPNLVYLIKSKSKSKSRRQKRERFDEAAKSMSNPLDVIIQLRKLSDSVGGLKNLKKLVDLLAV